MVAAEGRLTSNSFLLMIYSGLLLGLIALYFGLMVISESFFGFSLENSSMGAIVVMVAAMTTGMTWYERSRQMPSSRRKWAFAALAGLVTLIVQVLMVWFVLQADPQMMRELAGEDGVMKALLVVLVWLFDLLVVRIGVWMGLRTSHKQAQRLARKQS